MFTHPQGKKTTSHEEKYNTRYDENCFIPYLHKQRPTSPLTVPYHIRGQFYLRKIKLYFFYILRLDRDSDFII